MRVLSGRGVLPISLTIVTTFVVLIVLALGSVLAISYFASLRNTLDLIGEMAGRSSRFVIDELRDHLDPVAAQVNWTAELLANGPVDLNDEQAIAQVLLGALSTTPQVTLLVYVSQDEKVVRALRGGPERPWRIVTDPPREDSGLLQALRAGRKRDEAFWNEILFSERFERSYINFVRPVRRDGAFLGVVLAAVSLNRLSDLTIDISEKDGSTIFILVERDQVIAHPNLTSSHPELSTETPTVGLSRVGDLILEQFWSAEAHPMELSPELVKLNLRQTSIADQRYVFAHTEVEGYGDSPWIVGSHQDAETAEAHVKALQRSALVGLAMALASIGLAVFLGRVISRPIKTASAGAAHIAELEISEVKPLPRSLITELDTQARSFNAMLSALRWFQTYVPRSLVRRLMGRGEGEIPSEERALTILFTDLVSFTSTSEAMTARETADLLNHHFALLGACVEREEGTIDKFIGDALMAFWGAPSSQPDQADRAVRAVCAMARAVRDDNAQRRSRGLPPVRMRLGLHSGPAVVGNIGAPERMNYTVVGDTVNTAQRMEGLGKEVAPDAEIVILASESVIGALTIEAAREPVGAFTVKGKTEPIQVFRILAP